MWHAMHAPAGPSGLWCECFARDSGVPSELWRGKQTLFPAGVARAANRSGRSGACGSWHAVHGRFRAGPLNTGHAEESVRLLGQMKPHEATVASTKEIDAVVFERECLADKWRPNFSLGRVSGHLVHGRRNPLREDVGVAGPAGGRTDVVRTENIALGLRNGRHSDGNGRRVSTGGCDRRCTERNSPLHLVSIAHRRGRIGACVFCIYVAEAAVARRRFQD
jgi:hypothetical protein